jgi:hypothetical protein
MELYSAQHAGGDKGTGGKGDNARPEGDSRVSCRIRLLAYLTLEVFFSLRAGLLLLRARMNGSLMGGSRVGRVGATRLNLHARCHQQAREPPTIPALYRAPEYTGSIRATVGCWSVCRLCPSTACFLATLLVGHVMCALLLRSRRKNPRSHGSMAAFVAAEAGSRFAVCFGVMSTTCG